jgi:hypothetical protein
LHPRPETVIIGVVGSPERPSSRESPVPLESIRRPLLVVAIVLFALAFLVEIGSSGFLGLKDSDAASSLHVPTPGLGVPSLAALDGLQLWVLLLIGAGLVIPGRIQGKLQGIATLVVSLLGLIGAVVLVLTSLLLLVVMVSLLLAVPFGTIAYFAIYSTFDKSGAQIALSLLMSLKLGFAICLLLAHWRFLQNRGLVLMTLTSLLATIVVGFLHGLVPGFLASITDAIAAIVVGIVAAIRALILLIRSIPSIVKALRVDRGTA